MLRVRDTGAVASILPSAIGLSCGIDNLLADGTLRLWISHSEGGLEAILLCDSPETVDLTTTLRASYPARLLYMVTRSSLSSVTSRFGRLAIAGLDDVFFVNQPVEVARLVHTIVSAARVNALCPPPWSNASREGAEVPIAFRAFAARASFQRQCLRDVFRRLGVNRRAVERTLARWGYPSPGDLLKRALVERMTSLRERGLTDAIVASSLGFDSVAALHRFHRRRRRRECATRLMTVANGP